MVHLSSSVALGTTLESGYGLRGTLTPIATEKDDTYKLQTASGDYLVKVSAPDEPDDVVDLQTSAMRHLERTAPGLRIQRVVTSRTGATHVPLLSMDPGEARSLRVLRFVDGRLLREVEPVPQLLAAVGRAHAEMTCALAAFTHPRQGRYVKWDLQNFSGHRPLIDDVLVGAQQSLATAIFDRFDRDVRPHVDGLHRQFVHGDVSPFNVVVDDDGLDVAGFIDFGDSTHSATIFDLSVPLSNQLTADAADPWQHAHSYVRGYSRVRAIPHHELALLPVTAPARLLLRILMSGLSATQGDPARRDYLLSHGTNDWRNLEAAWSVPNDVVTTRLNAAVHEQDRSQP